VGLPTGEIIYLVIIMMSSHQTNMSTALEMTKLCLSKYQYYFPDVSFVDEMMVLAGWFTFVNFPNKLAMVASRVDADVDSATHDTVAQCGADGQP